MIADYYVPSMKAALRIDTDAQRIVAVITGPAAPHLKGVQNVRELKLADYTKRTYFDTRRGTLYVDGLAIIDVITWLVNRRADWTGRLFWREFDRLFGPGDGCRIAEYPKSAVGAAFGDRLPGELGFFARQFFQQHADAFAELQRGESMLIELITE